MISKRARLARINVRLYHFISSHRHSRLAATLADAARRYLGAFDHSSGDARFNGEEDLLRRLSSAGRLTIVDCGANVGTWARSARLSFPNATIHAIEPIAETLTDLKTAVAHDADVFVHAVALSDHIGVASMAVDDRNRATASLTASGAGSASRLVTVPLTTGDQFLDEHSIAHLHLLKIDAEGHDLAVLHGFRRALDHRLIDVIQFEISGWNAMNRTWVGEFFDLLNGVGYVVGRVVPGGAELGPYRPGLEDFSRTQNFVAVDALLTDMVNAVTGAYRSDR